MGTTELLRPRAARALGAVMVATSVGGLVAALVDGWTTVLHVGAPVALFGVFGWAAFVQPHVVVTDGAVTIANTWRTVEVPWPAIEEVDGRYGLQLQTAYGRITAWGAASPVGRQRARGEQSLVAAAVRRRHEELRTAGHLEDARLERPDLRVAWHVRTLGAAVLLAVATLVLPPLA